MRFSLRMTQGFCALVVIAILASADNSQLSAADTPRETVRTAERALSKAGEAYRGGDAAAAAAELGVAKGALASLSPDKVPAAMRLEVQRLNERLAAAEKLVATAQQGAGKGMTPAKTKRSVSATDSKAAKSKKQVRGKRAPAPVPAGPSFTSEVAPLLVAKCGNCHVRGTQGDFSMATFAALEKGSKDGVVYRPRASQGSILIEVISNGAMPKRGARVTPEELATLSRWIDAGAVFDGLDRNMRLDRLSDASAAGLVRATGQESVQFNRDIAPLLVTHCLECHGKDQASGQLQMETFADLLKGGVTGKPIETGKPEESLIVKRLKGIDGDRMPQDKDALPDEAITKVATWIREGAHFDGADPTQPLRVAVEENLARGLSHQELTAKRLAQAEKIWALAVPDEKASILQTDNFTLLGNATPVQLRAIADLAEAEQAKIAKWMKRDAAAPMVRGSLVLFVFKRSFDYSEFVRMVEQREVPKGVSGHAFAKGSDVYACIAATSDNEAALPAIVADQVAAGFLRSIQGVPPWFVAGAGRVIATRVEPKNPQTKRWDAEIQQQAAGDPGGEFLNAAVLDADSLTRSYAFVRAMSSNVTRFQSLIAAVAEGKNFSTALQDLYRATAREMYDAWSRRQTAGR